jgi:hypothetical protein
MNRTVADRVKSVFTHDIFWYLLCEVIFWITWGLSFVAYFAVVSPTPANIELTIFISMANMVTAFFAHNYRHIKATTEIKENVANDVLVLLYGFYTLTSGVVAGTMMLMLVIMVLVPI